MGRPRVAIGGAAWLSIRPGLGSAMPLAIWHTVRTLSPDSLIAHEVVRVGIPESCLLLSDPPEIIRRGGEDAGDEGSLRRPALAAEWVLFVRQAFDESNRAVGIDHRR